MCPKGVFSDDPTFFMKETASLTFFGGLPFIFRILSFFFSPIKRLIGTWELSGPMFQAKEAHVELKHKRSPCGAKILLTSPLRVPPWHKTRHKDPSVLLRFGWLLLCRINCVHRKSVETITATSSYVWEISEGPTWAKWSRPL